LREAVTASLVEDTTSGKLDAFIAALPLDHPGLVTEELFPDRFFLAVPSDDPAFAPLFRADMARARFACEHRAEEAQGPCAGFAADAARLGLSAQAWPIIEAQARRGCRVRGVATCPDSSSLIPATFSSDLRVFLRRTGYIAER